jgi:hypothetical protein
MNPIEHVWAFMKVKLKECTSKNRNELIANFHRIWNEISLEFVRKLIDSMPRRSEALVRAKGDATKY